MTEFALFYSDIPGSDDCGWRLFPVVRNVMEDAQYESGAEFVTFGGAFRERQSDRLQSVRVSFQATSQALSGTGDGNDIEIIQLNRLNALFETDNLHILGALRRLIHQVDSAAVGPPGAPLSHYTGEDDGWHIQGHPRPNALYALDRDTLVTLAYEIVWEELPTSVPPLTTWQDEAYAVLGRIADELPILPFVEDTLPYSLDGND